MPVPCQEKFLESFSRGRLLYFLFLAMNALHIVFLSVVPFAAAYFLYGRFISRRLFGMNSNRPTPALKYTDGLDYVPSKRFVLFGHHFASIAGLGPILGPAIAVIWGWIPAFLWIVLGTIFIGAVHDLTSLCISQRYDGRSIGEITRSLMGARAGFLFLIIVFFLLGLVVGVFILTIAGLFEDFYPAAVLPALSLIPIAMLIGLFIYRVKMGLSLATLVGLILMAIMVLVGKSHPIRITPVFTPPEVKESLREGIEAGKLSAGASAQAGAAYLRETGKSGQADSLDAANGSAKTTWVFLLLGYALVASVLPVWLLLQPRDYLNSYQLYLGLILMYLGIFVLRPEIVAPGINPAIGEPDAGIPPLFPFLFITVACGAISGFHSLVSSGTTTRQLASEGDANFIGYGAMLTEGALGSLVLLACVAGFASPQEWNLHYESWGKAGGLAGCLSAYIRGAGLFVSSIGIDRTFSEVLIAVVAVGFAFTSLDSATRLLRYNIEEIGKCARVTPLRNRYLASLLAVSVSAFFALMKIQGLPVGKTLWQLFGTTNQLLAGLGLLTVTLYLFLKKKPVYYTLIPMIFMLVMTLYAMGRNILKFIRSENYPLICVGAALFIMALWLTLEAVLSIRKPKEERNVP